MTIRHPNLTVGKECSPWVDISDTHFCKAPTELAWVPAIPSLNNLVILALSRIILSLIHVARCTVASEAQLETQLTIFFLKKYGVILPNTCSIF